LKVKVYEMKYGNDLEEEYEMDEQYGDAGDLTWLSLSFVRVVRPVGRLRSV
jgi:hypothetical protein